MESTENHGDYRSRETEINRKSVYRDRNSIHVVVEKKVRQVEDQSLRGHRRLRAKCFRAGIFHQVGAPPEAVVYSTETGEEGGST